VTFGARMKKIYKNQKRKNVISGLSHLNPSLSSYLFVAILFVKVAFLLIAGVYILASQKNISPPSLKFFPVFVFFCGLLSS